MSDAETKELAEIFGVPVLLNSNLVDGSLRESAVKNETKILLYEAGEALRFDEFFNPCWHERYIKRITAFRNGKKINLKKEKKWRLLLLMVANG